jgi:hypothetical protein
MASNTINYSIFCTWDSEDAGAQLSYNTDLAETEINDDLGYCS